MNRDRKYRVWDNQENKFFEPVYEAYLGKLLDLSISLCGTLLRRTMEMPAEDESSFPDRYIINDWIGRKDKNDKLIFEGDILREKFEGQPDVYMEVVFRDSAYGYLGDITGKFFAFIDEDIDECEVVGNIYPNADLLTEVKECDATDAK